MQNTSQCITCNLSYFQCPGHPGHIDLDVIVYRPMLFQQMFTLLKTKCAYCHKMKLSENKCRQVLIKLKLLQMNNLQGLEELEDLLNPLILEAKDNEKQVAHLQEIESKLKLIETMYISYNKSKEILPFHKKLQTDIIKGFYKQAMHINKCENCNAISPKYRKDGYSKIFQRPLSKSSKQIMRAKMKEFQSGLEALQGNGNDIVDDDSDNESDDENDVDDIQQTDKYLVPIEVEAQIKLLWRHHQDLLFFIWSRAFKDISPDCGYSIFFTKICLVPPSRFRPFSKVGELMSEHPQNEHLKKILETNERIRTIQMENLSKSTMMMIQDQDSSSASLDEELHVPISLPSSNLSQLISNWIALQNAINCFMDSSRDPNPLQNQSPAGIRQLLERKEGLFRMHMMGKRVNFCCRSVISPDPNIGMNEIGIPVHFAKTLHYPVPVNDWNVKYLRTLVERGPFEYPGKEDI